MLTYRKVLDLLTEEDALALATGLWLGDDSASRLGLHELPQFVVLCRQHPCFGIEVVLLGELLAHANQVSCEVVFAGQVEHTWKVVDFLKRTHSC